MKIEICSIFRRLSLQEFLKSYPSYYPSKEVLEDFLIKKEELLEECNKEEGEEFQKNLISKFLEKTFLINSTLKNGLI